jgi:hypothetical protein
MNVVLYWLARWAFLLYLVALIGVVAYVATAIAARRRNAAAQFSLERDITRRQVARAWMMAGMFLALGVVVFLVTSYVVPQLPPPEAATPVAEAGLTPVPTATPSPTPTLTPAPVVTGTLDVEGAEPTDVPPVEVTATPSPTPQPTNPPPAEPPNCPSPNVQIIAPAAGSTVSGMVEVWGTAQINSFAYYKFEVQFPESETPNFIMQAESPVENEILGYWDVSNAELYPAGGPYRFRLVAVDIYGNTTSCIIPVYIAH